jgi:hypothetical protein
VAKEDDMTKHILKGAGLAVVLGLLALSAPASVAAADIRANVPFSFTVNKRVLPPGAYTVSNNNTALLVRGATSGAVTLGQAAQSATSTSPKLVFHRYGDEYILREVWMGSGSGHLLPESRREHELAGGRSGAATASVSFERVEVAIQ